VVINDVLYHLWTIKSRRRHEVRLQLVVPSALREQVLKAHHDSSLAGHRGIQATYDKIRKNYFWVNMFADIYEYVQSCEVCAAVKTSTRGAASGLRPVSSATPT